MNELNKLIHQYETENPGKKAREQIEYDYGLTDEGSPTTEFAEWLASRPTCTPNERAFLDEIREKGELLKVAMPTTDAIWFGSSIIRQSDITKSNLKDLVNDIKTKAD